MGVGMKMMIAVRNGVLQNILARKVGGHCDVDVDCHNVEPEQGILKCGVNTCLNSTIFPRHIFPRNSETFGLQQITVDTKLVTNAIIFVDKMRLDVRIMKIVYLAIIVINQLHNTFVLS